MEIVSQTCERHDCDDTGPLVNLAATPIAPCDWRQDAPEDATIPVWVCEEHAEEFNQRVSFEIDLTPTAFVAESLIFRQQAYATLRSVFTSRQRAQ